MACLRRKERRRQAGAGDSQKARQGGPRPANVRIRLPQPALRTAALVLRPRCVCNQLRWSTRAGVAPIAPRLTQRTKPMPPSLLSALLPRPTPTTAPPLQCPLRAAAAHRPPAPAQRRPPPAADRLARRGGAHAGAQRATARAAHREGLRHAAASLMKVRESCQKTDFVRVFRGVARLLSCSASCL